MFIVILDYTAPLEEIDRHLEAHNAWLEENYTAGHFLASGRQDPRTGGLVLARAADREALGRILALDPFGIAEVATHTVIDWRPSRASAEAQWLLRP
ncbi:YciI family protein [Streptomyces sp. STR69]|uniref:YciI family protein n=1 Tax=Streptomyces sp. STR69 TaxID=1796942 RepID=UPI0021C722A0|nr:YciI family protein [Streptomyces sp. STR69]